MRYVRRTAAAVVVLALALAGVSGGAASSAPRAAAPKADWTMMIYAVADTENIATQMTVGLNKLVGLPEMKNVHVVMLIDNPPAEGKDRARVPLRGVGTFSTAKLVELQPTGWKEIKDEGELSMGTPANLSSFIATTAAAYPAEHYGLMLDDHGSAYSGGYWDQTPTPTHLTVAALRDGINAGLQQAGIARLDVIEHAACLMSSYEAASALAPLADVVAGSEEIMYGSDIFNRAAFAALGNGATGSEFAKTNLDGYRDYVDAQIPFARPFTAESIIDTESFATFDAAMASLARALTAHMEEVAPTILKAREKALTFVDGVSAVDQDPDDPDAIPWDLVDLGDFLRQLQDVPDDVAVARDAAFTALQNVVAYQATAQATQQATGLNVYLPTDQANVFGYFSDRAAPSEWSDFVQAFLNSSVARGDGQAAKFIDAEARAAYAGADGVLVEGQLRSGDEQNVVSQDLGIYTEVGGRRARVLRIPASLNAGALGVVQGSWNYAVARLGDGTKKATLDVTYQGQSGGLVGTALANYVPPSGGDPVPVRLQVLLDSAGSITSFGVFEAGDGKTAAVDLEPGGTLTPVLRFFGADGTALGNVPSSESVSVTPQLAVSSDRLAAGSIFDAFLLVTGLDKQVNYALLPRQAVQ